MLDSVQIKNFRCLRDVTLKLEPLTVLIGPNDSGKSTVLDALYRLGRSTTFPLFARYKRNAPTLGGPAARRDLIWLREPRNLQWSVQGQTDDRFDYTLTVQPKEDEFSERLLVGDRRVTFGSSRHGMTGLAESNSEDCRKIRRSIATTEPYCLFPNVMRAASELGHGSKLEGTGSNLAAALDGLMTGPDRQAIIAMEESLRSQIPSLHGYALESRPTMHEGGGTEKILRFVLQADNESRVVIPASQVSDGALLLTAFLLLAYSDTPDVILIEEPENGLHPTRLAQVIDILRKITTGEIGNRPRQVVLTTHSPLLLNLAKPEEVRILTRDDDGGTNIVALNDVPDVDKLLDEFGIGELWYLLGEEKLIRGTRP